MEKEIEISQDDILVLKLSRSLAQWVGVQPLEEQIYVNQLFPPQDREKPLFKLRDVDVDIQCHIVAVTMQLDRNTEEIDHFTGTMLSHVLMALRAGSYTYAARMKNVEPDQTIFWAIRRHNNKAHWTEVTPSEVEKLRGILGSLTGL